MQTKNTHKELAILGIELLSGVKKNSKDYLNGYDAVQALLHVLDNLYSQKIELMQSQQKDLDTAETMLNKALLKVNKKLKEA